MIETKIRIRNTKPRAYIRGDELKDGTSAKPDGKAYVVIEDRAYRGQYRVSYWTMKRVFEMEPEELMECIARANLINRGITKQLDIEDGLLAIETMAENGLITNFEWLDALARSLEPTAVYTLGTEIEMRGTLTDQYVWRADR